MLAGVSRRPLSPCSVGRRENQENRVPALLGRSWPALGLFWAALGVSFWFFGLPGASGSDFRTILEAFGEPKSMIFEALFRTSRGLFLGLFFSQFFVRRCSEICALCTWQKKGTQADSSKKTRFWHDVSKFAWSPRSPRGRQERTKTRTQTEQKNINKHVEKLDFCRPRAKPPKLSLIHI